MGYGSLGILAIGWFGYDLFMFDCFRWAAGFRAAGLRVVFCLVYCLDDCCFNLVVYRFSSRGLVYVSVWCCLLIAVTSCLQWVVGIVVVACCGLGMMCSRVLWVLGFGSFGLLVVGGCLRLRLFDLVGVGLLLLGSIGCSLFAQFGFLDGCLFC